MDSKSIRTDSADLFTFAIAWKLPAGAVTPLLGIKKQIRQVVIRNVYKENIVSLKTKILHQ